MNWTLEFVTKAGKHGLAKSCLREECRQSWPASTTQPLKKDDLSTCVSTDKLFNLILKLTVGCLKEEKGNNKQAFSSYFSPGS